MTAQNYAGALTLVLAHEGGYVDHPKDPGGPTNKGVTQRVYDSYRKTNKKATRSVRHIEDFEISDIYRKQYWDRVRGSELPAGIDYAVFDYGVNSGPARAIKDLQRTLNSRMGDNEEPLGADGVLGELTLEQCRFQASSDEEGLIADYCARRMGFLKSLKTWKTFGKGWSRRVVGDFEGVQDGDHGVLDYATAMARKDLEFPLKPAELPKAIGSKEGEVPGKAPEKDQAKLKTAEGSGLTIAAVGAAGQQVQAMAKEVQPHIGDTLLGRLAMALFLLLMVAGALLVGYSFFKRWKEKG